MKIEVLGCYGGKDKNKNTTSFKIAKNIVIDAGNILNALGDDAKNIDHIFLTHSHLDHIQDIPFLLDTFFSYKTKPIYIYGLKSTLDDLKKHIFNWNIWPDFDEIDLFNEQKSIVFKDIKIGDIIKIDNTKLEVISADHSVDAVGYIINDNTLITGDTYLNNDLINNLQQKDIKNLIIETSFPSNMIELAKISKHLTPSLIDEIIKKVNKKLNIYIYHIKPQFETEIKKEFNELNLDVVFLQDNMFLNFENKKYIIKNKKHYFDAFIDVTKSLSLENNLKNILKMVVDFAREYTGADGATLYIKSEDDKYLDFKIVQNETLNIFLDENIPWPSLPLYKDSKPNREMVAVVAALDGEIINIKDVYYVKKYNFEGTKKFDKNTGYRSKSMLVIPLKNHENEIIGVLQLINKIKDDEIVSFSKEDENLVYSLSSIAAISMTKDKLIKDFELLLESLIKTIGMAIDEKSKYTGGHVRRVSEIAVMLAKEIYKSQNKPVTENDLKIIEIAGWLHDIGKITTPEYIMDKATKLEKLYDRIENIKYKFEVLKRDYEIKYLKNEISKDKYENIIKSLDDDFEFLKEVNKGGEFLSEDKIKRIQKIALYKIGDENILNDDEVKNLSIKKGTLTEEEREKIQDHAAVGLKMLNALHFPKKYKRVVDIAANHHEKLNGKGYPRGLSAKNLSTEERLMAIADIFEALTASDRPYKEPKKLSEVFKILYFMSKDNEIDKEIIKIFIKNNIYLEYAKKELKSFQIDEIDKEILDYFFK